MPNIVTKVFTQNSSWTAPAGVTSVLVGSVKNINSIQQGYFSSFSLDPFGNAYAWGTNSFGSLGTNNSTTYSSPTAVVGGLTFQQLFTSQYNGFGLTPQGKLYSWGYNGNGQLANSSTTNQSSPVAAGGGLTFQSIFCAFDSSSVLGLTTGGVLYSWGANVFGQLGIGNVTSQSAPVAVLGGLTFSSMVNSNSNALALTPSGAAYAWGNSNFGALGTGSALTVSSPVAVLGGLTFQSIIIDLNTYSTYGLATNGSLYSWGYNNAGQLGIGNVTNQSSPILVLGSLKFQSVSAIGGSVFGLTTSGALYAWGSNNNGQLGIGNVTNQSSPVLVLGGFSFQSVFINNNFDLPTDVFALTTSGVLYGWGENTNGELGIGNATPQSSPVAVLGGLSFASITACGNSVLGLTNSGALYAWGYNSGGQLGNGNVTSQSSPVAVLGGLLFNALPSTSTRTIAVVPGTAYAITLAQFYASFGHNVVAQGGVNLVTLQYNQ